MVQERVLLERAVVEDQQEEHINSKNQTYDNNLISYDLNLGSSEMFECDYAS